MKTCPHGGKVSYPNERRAKIARITMDKYGSNVKAMRTYQCPYCHFFHFTSRKD